MSIAPRIWLDYRPVRIGWIVESRDITQLATVARWNTCLWGGYCNPVIPLHDRDLANGLIQVFGVDVLLPVVPTASAKSFVDTHAHLHFHMGRDGIFSEKRCEFIDVRHTARRFSLRGCSTDSFRSQKPTRPTWATDDPLSSLLTLMLGNYPSSSVITINYAAGLAAEIGLTDKPIEATEALSAEWLQLITPLGFTSLGLSYQGERSTWTNPGVVLGDAGDFDDLVLFWNLRAAGAQVSFYDATNSDRMQAYTTAFIDAFGCTASGDRRGMNFWSRAQDGPIPAQYAGLELSKLQRTFCRGAGDGLWNGLNVRPVRPQFTAWHRDVVTSFLEGDDSAVTSFALPDRPFDDTDSQILSQHFVVSVDASQFGLAPDNLTFATPFVPRLNEFYGRSFHINAKARAERGSLDRGAVGIITSVGTQRLEVRAIRVHRWMQAFFGLFGVSVVRSEPGLRCSRLIHQLGGLQACRVFKVRGARRLIREYRPDQSFTRGAAEQLIGDYDGQTKRMQFSEYENLYIQPRDGGKLTPGEVFQYMTARGVFRVGLDLKCPNCELTSWLPLDDIQTQSTCAYCGHRFDVTLQLKDRDWRYRRTGLFGREDNQLGAVPVTLALQQLELALHDRILMCSTALEFTSKTTVIEKCEADFVAVVAGAEGIEKSPVQVLLGEAKTGNEFDADDVRKLGQLADAVPEDLADAFIMFAKADEFTADEIRLAQTLNSKHRYRVILWSREQLEPLRPYAGQTAKLGQDSFAGTLGDMARATHRLWFAGFAPDA